MFRVGGGDRGLQGPGCGRRATGPLGAGGSGGRAARRRTREGSPRLEMMGGGCDPMDGSHVYESWHRTLLV